MILSCTPTGISVKVVAPNILGDCFRGKAHFTATMTGRVGIQENY